MTTRGPGEDLGLGRLTLAGLLSLLLLASCIGLLISLHVCLVGGPRWFSVWTILAVSVALPGTLFCFIARREPAGPAGLSSKYPRVRILAPLLTRTFQVVAVTWLVAWPTFLCTSLLPGGIEHGPVFASHERYELVNHGRKTEVSRMRYLIVGTSQMLAFHATGLAVVLFALHSFLFGDPLARPADPADTPDRQQEQDPECRIDTAP